MAGSGTAGAPEQNCPRRWGLILSAVSGSRTFEDCEAVQDCQPYSLPRPGSASTRLLPWSSTVVLASSA
jgi:hypothetical protein